MMKMFNYLIYITNYSKISRHKNEFDAEKKLDNVYTKNEWWSEIDFLL